MVKELYLSLADVAFGSVARVVRPLCVDGRRRENRGESAKPPENRGGTSEAMPRHSSLVTAFGEAKPAPPRPGENLRPPRKQFRSWQRKASKCPITILFLWTVFRLISLPSGAGANNGLTVATSEIGQMGSSCPSGLLPPGPL